MTKSTQRTIFKVLFFIWTFIWINFILRDLIGHKHFRDYKTLLARDEEGKRSYVYGDCLFEFLRFCKNKLPEKAKYDLVGMKEFSIAKVRSVYFLYPHLKTDDADFLLVYEEPGYERDGYKTFDKLDNARFILKKI